MNKKHDPFFEKWEWDLTPKVSKYIQDNFSFVVLQIDDKKERLLIESKIISTVSLCDGCKPSKNWLGLYSPREKIKESGLWLVNELYKQSLSAKYFIKLKEFAAKEKFI